MISIPNGSVNFNILCANPSLLAGLTVIQSMGNPLLNANMRVTAATNANFDTGIGSVPLMVGSRFLDIINTNGAVADNVRALFSIAF